MKPIIYMMCALCLIAAPVYAQEEGEDTQDGLSLIEEGTRLIMRQLMDGMGEALEDLDEMAVELGPVIEELRLMLGDLSAYHLPEVLPNGDIIIRRKIPLQVEPPQLEPGTEIEL